MLTLRASISTGPLSVALALALGVGVLACKPGGEGEEGEDQPATPIPAEDAPAQLAEQICAQLFACECPVIGSYGDEAGCVISLTAELEQVIDPVLEGGGTWNPECAGELAKAMSDWDCLGPSMASREASFDPRSCPILKGTRGLGSECWQSSFGDECQEGLSCIDNTCVEMPVLPVPEGGVCESQWEPLPCAAGTWCTWVEGSEARTCQPLPEAGDACLGGYLCGPAANDLICEAEVCTSAPGEGESCEQYLLCSAGLYCDGGKDFTCQPRRELGEGCGGDPVCPVDASCINNICEPDPAQVCNIVSLF